MRRERPKKRKEGKILYTQDRPRYSTKNAETFYRIITRFQGAIYRVISTKYRGRLE